MKSQTATTGTGVWERLWRNPPSEEKDRRNLARERHCVRWSRFSRALEGAFGRIAGLTTIELGSGRGDVSVLLAQCGAGITLVDSNATVLDQARMRFERLGLAAEYVQADLLALPRRLLGRFEVSVSLGVVEHFQGRDRHDSIASHARVLKDGGMSMISVPNAACIPYRLWKAYLELRGWWPYGMEIPYWRGELRRLARATGLAPAELFAYGWWQAVGDNWARGIFGAECPWSAKSSVLDDWMGATLVMIARRS